MAGHVGTPLPSGTAAGVRSAPKLITADPALELVDRWHAELSVLRRRSPGSDAVTTLADCVRELVAAINAGQDVSVQLTLVEAHALSHIPVSTLRWMCNNKPESIGARKREGVWYIDRGRFERYLATPGQRGRLAHESPAAVADACGSAVVSAEEVA